MLRQSQSRQSVECASAEWVTLRDRTLGWILNPTDQGSLMSCQASVIRLDFNLQHFQVFLGDVDALLRLPMARHVFCRFSCERAYHTSCPPHTFRRDRQLHCIVGINRTRPSHPSPLRRPLPPPLGSCFPRRDVLSWHAILPEPLNRYTLDYMLSLVHVRYGCSRSVEYTHV